MRPLSAAPGQYRTGLPHRSAQAFSPATGKSLSDGTFTFYDGKTVLGTVPADPGGYDSQLLNIVLSVGTHSVTAVYSGDGKYSGSTSTAEVITVVSAAVFNFLPSYATTAVAGQAYTVAVSQSAFLSMGVPPTGTLTLQDGSSVLASINLATTPPNSSYQYLLTVAAGLPVGTDDLEVVYSGDLNYSGASVNLSPITVTSPPLSGNTANDLAILNLAES